MPLSKSNATSADADADFENPTAGLAISSPASRILKFEREDWTSFRAVEGLQQKAGVPKALLPRLVLKELADNALDAGAEARVGELPKGGNYFVEDDGPGIDGTPEEIARLFSIRRPMVSSKLLRLPTRGALGNGPARGRRCGAREWRHPHRHHPQSPYRAPS